MRNAVRKRPLFFDEEKKRSDDGGASDEKGREGAIERERARPQPDQTSIKCNAELVSRYGDKALKDNAPRRELRLAPVWDKLRNEVRSRGELLFGEAVDSGWSAKYTEIG